MIESLRYVYPVWRRILLFQSLSQAASYLLTVGLVLICFVILARLIGWGYLPWASYVGAFLGALVSVWLVQPCTFIVQGSHFLVVMRLLEERISRYGYRLDTRMSNNQVLCYRHKLPRWLTWKENDVRITRMPNAIEVYGPQYVLKRLHALAMRHDM